MKVICGLQAKMSKASSFTESESSENSSSGSLQKSYILSSKNFVPKEKFFQSKQIPVKKEESKKTQDLFLS